MTESDRPARPPEGLLRAARQERGWSQSEAAAELAALAGVRGVPVAAPASLKTQLSRWENGHAVPEEQYRSLLRELYGHDDAALGMGAPAAAPAAEVEADALRAMIATAAAVDAGAIELLREQLAAARRVDRQLGAPAVIESVRSQVSYLEQILAHGLTSTGRAASALLLAEAAALAGWQALDVGAVNESWRHFETAKSAAREAPSAALLSYALAGQAAILVDLDEPVAARRAAEQAADADDGSVPRLEAWLAANRGEVLAAAGDRAGSRRAFDRAERRLAVDAVHPAAHFVEFDATALHRGRGHAMAQLGEAGAVGHLERALADPDGNSARATAELHIDLASALAATGHPAEAADHARQARAITSRIGSVRLRARLQRATSPAGH